MTLPLPSLKLSVGLAIQYCGLKLFLRHLYRNTRPIALVPYFSAACLNNALWVPTVDYFS